MDPIKSLGQDPRWEALKLFAEELMDKIRKDQFETKSTQWETTSHYLKAAGQIEGIQRLIQEVNKRALE